MKFFHTWLKDSMSFVADFSATITLIFFLISKVDDTFVYFLKVFKENLLLFIIYLFLTILIIIFLISSTKRSWNNIVSSWRKEKIDSYLSRQALMSHELLDIKKYIPSHNKILYIYKTLTNEAKLWSHDAEIISFNLYLKRNINYVDVSTQTFIKSEWKGEILTIYHPKISKRYQKDNGIDYGTHTFFEIKNWRKAIIMAYEKLSSTLPDQFSIQISGPHTLSDTNTVSIGFSYKIGEVDFHQSFSFDGTKLIFDFDASEIIIK
jgi:hypothetical protein